VAQALDFAGTINTVRAPFFAHFAKHGGNASCVTSDKRVAAMNQRG
jgi:hypothetical protein